MRVYHERLWVPLLWWLLGLAVIVLLGAELAAGFGWWVTAGIYLVLVGVFAARLVSWGWARVEVSSGELLAGRKRLPLAAAGQVTALSPAQARALRGPRADPAAVMLLRSYLRHTVYIEVTDPAQNAPYWLLGTRHPAELTAAINQSRPAARAGGAAVG